MIVKYVLLNHLPLNLKVQDVSFRSEMSRSRRSAMLLATLVFKKIIMNMLNIYGVHI
jgi:hypothetical protein